MERDWQQILNEAVRLGREVAPGGKVATYIPELARVDPLQVGMALVGPDGLLHEAGDSRAPFTLQSVSKVLTLILALMDAGEDAVFSRVGVEPTGDAFNSIVRLEKGPDRPFNPFINAGAIAIADLIAGENLTERLARLLDFVRRLSANAEISINSDVALSEWTTGHRNRALAYFMKDQGILTRGVEETLRLYFAQCAIQVSTADLAKIAARLAFPDGSIPAPVLRSVTALMVTCGHYDGSGEFAVRVGMAGKSGVGGGIIAFVPGRAAAATFGPALDSRGNSIAGFHMLEHLATRSGIGLFDPPRATAPVS